MPRRNNIHRLLVLAPLGLLLSACLHAQVDCISPAKIVVSRVQGQIFDPTGVAVPGVRVSLVSESGSRFEVTTDQDGQFKIPASPGRYQFKAVVPVFQTASVDLEVGRDVVSMAHPSYLYVVLGMNGSFCPWITTSKRDFQKIIDSNKKRLKETSQHNATQK